MIKVSIIIPVYNVEIYLPACLDSCVNQSLEEIEIIVINDASPDYCSKIMEDYGSRYPDKIVNVLLKTNIKQGGARNLGIKMARGKYLCFVDGDDYIDRRMCEILYDLCEKERLDIACCNGYHVKKEGIFYWERFKKQDFPIHLLENFTGQCYMIIRKAIITKNNLFYPEKIIGEDTSVAPLWYLLASKIAFIKTPLYYQVMREDSTSSSVDTVGAAQILQALGILKKNAERLGVYQKHKACIDSFIFMRIVIAVKYFIKEKTIRDRQGLELFKMELSKWKNYSFDETCFFNCLSRSEYRLGKLFLEDFTRGLDLSWDEYNCWMNQYGYMDQEKKIKELAGYLITSRGRELVVWGNGERGRQFTSTMKRLDMKYFMGDNNPHLWEKQIETGDIVHNFEWMIKHVSNPVFLITATRSFEEIVSNMEKKYTKVKAVDVFSFMKYDMDVNELGV